MNQVNSVVISRRDYKDENELWAKIAQQIRILLETGYILVAEDVDERGGTVVIQYAPSANAPKGTPKPFWLLPNEMMAAADTHINNEVKKANEIIDSAKRADAFANAFDFKKGNDDDGGNHFDA